MNNYAHKFTQKTGTFYMPKHLIRPEGFHTEEMSTSSIEVVKAAKVAPKATPKAKVSEKKEA